MSVSERSAGWGFLLMAPTPASASLGLPSPTRGEGRKKLNLEHLAGPERAETLARHARLIERRP